jgi:hypothetical protein
MRLKGWPLRAIAVVAIAAAAKKAKKRGRKAVKVYYEEVSAGSRPIEAVGTAVAAFVGLAPGGPLNTP